MNFVQIFEEKNEDEKIQLFIESFIIIFTYYIIRKLKESLLILKFNSFKWNYSSLYIIYIFRITKHQRKIPTFRWDRSKNTHVSHHIYTEAQKWHAVVSSFFFLFYEETIIYPSLRHIFVTGPHLDCFCIFAKKYWILQHSAQ